MHGTYLSRCIDVYLCMGCIFLGASMLEHGAYLSRCVDVRLCMGRVFLGASMSSLWDWPSFSCDFWISCVEFWNLCFTYLHDFYWWFLEFVFHQFYDWHLYVVNNCGLVNEIRSMTFLLIFEKILVIVINLLLIFIYLFITAWHCDYYMFSHISYSISSHLIFIARLIRLLFSY